MTTMQTLTAHSRASQRAADARLGVEYAEQQLERAHAYEELCSDQLEEFDCPYCAGHVNHESNFGSCEDCGSVYKMDDFCPVWQASLEQLRAGFDLVKNKSDWRMPIDAWIEDSCLVLRAVEDAVRFFTSTDISVVEKREGEVRVTAMGYRNGPAGDH